MNPYYESDKLELDLLSFDEPDLSYEYNTLCFWATKEGQVYSASDSGCSCPTPFEDSHDRASRDKVLQTLERVGSLEQAEGIFDSWNRNYDGKPHLGADDKKQLTEWIKAKLK